MAIDVRRREFIVGLGGSLAVLPLTARAQQHERVRRIAMLSGLAANDPESLSRVAAFEQGLKELGWMEGRNLHIDFRWALATLQRCRHSPRSWWNSSPI